MSHPKLYNSAVIDKAAPYREGVLIIVCGMFFVFFTLGIVDQKWYMVPSAAIGFVMSGWAILTTRVSIYEMATDEPLHPSPARIKDWGLTKFEYLTRMSTVATVTTVLGSVFAMMAGSVLQNYNFSAAASGFATAALLLTAAAVSILLLPRSRKVKFI